MLILYNFFIRFYGLAISIFSLFNNKARQWKSGRKGWKQSFTNAFQKKEKRIWIHCSSLGEFEQGRNLIETLRKKYPSYKIVLSFFSPSGYEIRKNYEYADDVVYLPLDTQSNAAFFIETIQPSMAIFVKYEFWYHHLNELRKREIPALLISAVFRKDQSFFKWYGGFFRKMLDCFSMIFVQDENSRLLLQQIGKDKVAIAGDTRYDRVLAIAAQARHLSEIEVFSSGKKMLIAGSTWLEDEKLLIDLLPLLPSNYLLIIAPHEIDSFRIAEVKSIFNDAILYSELGKEFQQDKISRVLIIDNIGMLSSLYAYATIAFVGGGFQKGGIHNILEPAVFGAPVLFGPIYQKFVEANELVQSGYCFSVTSVKESKPIIEKLTSDENYYQHIHMSLQSFMQKKAGATDRIVEFISQKNYLNS